MKEVSGGSRDLVKRSPEASNIYFRRIARQPGCRSERATRVSFSRKEKNGRKVAFLRPQALEGGGTIASDKSRKWSA
jgi:hypothetical protein